MARRGLRTGGAALQPGRLLWLLVLVGCIVGCTSQPAGSVPSSAPAALLPGRSEAVTPAGGPTAQTIVRPARQAMLPATPSLSPTSTEVATASPSLTMAPSPTSTQVPPTLLPVAAGAVLPLSLAPLASVDTHITSGAVAVVGGQTRYYFASLDRTLYAYGAGGQRLWTERMRGPVYAVAPLPGGELAAGDDSGTVILLDPSGEQRWSHSFGTRVTSLSGALPEGLLAGGWDERLSMLALDPEQERILWQADLGSRVTAVAGLPGIALASTAGGSVRAFGLRGELLWVLRAGAPVTRLAAFPGHAGSGTGGDLVLAGAQDGRLIALDRGGNVRWQLTLGEGAPVWVRVEPEAGGALAIVAATGGSTPSLSAISLGGEWLWRLTLPSPAGAVAALDLDGDGSVEILAGLADGSILAYDLQGRLRTSAQAGLPVWDLLPAGGSDNARGLVLADLHAWRLVAGAGPVVKPRLSLPPLVPLSSTALPPAAFPGGGGGQPGSGAVLVFLGDVVPGRSMELQIDRYGPGYPWQGLSFLLQAADLTVANLECVMSARGVGLRKLYVIRAHPGVVETLTAAPIHLATLANNHVLDFGDDALGDTLDVLRSAGISAVGAGRTADEARRPALLDLNGVRVAVLAYAGAYWRDSADMPASDLVAWSEPNAVAADVRAARDLSDVVVVVLHAGKEYSRAPTEAQVAAAHAAIDAGAQLVVGHHPHVTQTVERYRDGLVVYSLGNALFDIQLQSAMQGDLLRVLLTRDGLAQVELWPFWIDGEIQPRLLEDGRGQPRMEVVYP